LSNDITLHDATEDVNQDCVYRWVSVQDLESDFDLLRCGTTTNIKEVSWLSTFKLNDIHSGHSQTCSIDHASNVTIEGNVVQASRNCFSLVSISVRACITSLVLGNNGLLSVESVLINVDFSINTVDIKIWSHSPWVNFDLSGIYSYEHFVDLLELFNALIACLSSKIKVINNLLS